MKITLIIIGSLIILIFCIYTYYGGFKKISLTTDQQGGETIVYEKVTGDYSQSSKYTNRIYHTLLNEDNVVTTKGIGIFYDNPQKVDKTKLRSDVGCVLDQTDSTTINKLSGKYQIKILPEGEFLVAEFPMKGSLSFIMGVMKIYPVINKYSEEYSLKDSPVTEIYDVPNKKIIYRKKLK